MDRPPLADLLAATRAALDRGDAAAAASAAGEAARTCTHMAAGGISLDREELGRLRKQQTELQAQALRAREALSARLAQAGRSRRAILAYRRRRPG